MNNRLEDYIRLECEEGSIYIKRDITEDLKDVDAAIFDCDGVLIDIRGSYNRAISKTATYILEGLTGSFFPERIITEDIIFNFRRSGGFNSDWDSCYSIIMFILFNLPEKMQRDIKSQIEETSHVKDKFERFNLIRKGMRGRVHRTLDDGLLKRLMVDLERFTSELDERGVPRVEELLLNNYENILKESFNDLRGLLYHPCRVGRSIVPTVFEEFFCGSNLYNETYKLKPRYYYGPGLIENGKVIIMAETLDRLSMMFMERRFGIASGSRFKSAEYILDDLMCYFKGYIFSDDIESMEDRLSREDGEVNLKKPNPFSLLKTAEKLEPFRRAVYVGDSMEDALTVKNAEKEDPRYIFVGVYRYSSPQEETLKAFLEAGVDVIAPTVNTIPYILRIFREKEI